MLISSDIDLYVDFNNNTCNRAVTMNCTVMIVYLLGIPSYQKTQKFKNKGVTRKVVQRLKVKFFCDILNIINWVFLQFTCFLFLLLRPEKLR